MFMEAANLDAISGLTSTAARVAGALCQTGVTGVSAVTATRRAPISSAARRGRHNHARAAAALLEQKPVPAPVRGGHVWVLEKTAARREPRSRAQATVVTSVLEHARHHALGGIA